MHFIFRFIRVRKYGFNLFVFFLLFTREIVYETAGDVYSIEYYIVRGEVHAKENSMQVQHVRMKEILENRVESTRRIKGINSS